MTPASNIFDIFFSDDELDEPTRNDHDELDRYLNTDVDRKVDDPIVWWLDHQHMYPRLSRMALDFLTVPGRCS